MQTALILDLRQLSESSTEELAEKLDRATETLIAIQAEAANPNNLGTPAPIPISSSSSRYNPSKLADSLQTVSDRQSRFGDTYSKDALHFRAFLRQKCIGYCRCRCHTRGALKSPNAITTLIGRLYMSYGGTPWTTAPPCDSPTCQSGGRSSIQLNYIFPAWLLQRAIAVSTSWDRRSRISIHIHFPSIIPDTHYIWRYIEFRDLPAVKRLLESKEVHPGDKGEDGDSLLLASVSADSLGTCLEMLLIIYNNL